MLKIKNQLMRILDFCYFFAVAVWCVCVRLQSRHQQSKATEAEPENPLAQLLKSTRAPEIL
jgi:hypothetical protein